MPLKYTPSKDGVDRANVWIRLRYTKEEIVVIKELAKRDGRDWRIWLESHAALGVEGDMCEQANEIKGE